jgi:hypothetical protein
MMEGSEKFPGGAGKEEEELIDLDFDFEELMDEPLDETLPEVSPEEEIIELVEVVEKGDVEEEAMATAELTGATPEVDTGEMPLSLDEEVRAGLDNMMEGFDTAEVDLGAVEKTGLSEESTASGTEADQVGEASDEDIDRDLELELEAALEGFDTSQIDVAEQDREDGLPQEIAGLFEEGATSTADEPVDKAFDTDAINLDELPELELPEGLETQLEEMGAEDQEGPMESELEISLSEEPTELKEIVETGLPEGQIELETGPGEGIEEFSEAPEQDFAQAEVEEVAFEDFEAVLGGDSMEVQESPAEGAPEEGAAMEEEMAFDDLGSALGGDAIEFEESPPVDATEEVVEVVQEEEEGIEEFQTSTEVVRPMEEPFDSETGLDVPAEAAVPGITEERLEAIITKVVEEVVERVARDAMVGVAERLITGAIEALKKNQETMSE